MALVTHTHLPFPQNQGFPPPIFDFEERTIPIRNEATRAVEQLSPNDTEFWHITLPPKLRGLSDQEIARICGALQTSEFLFSYDQEDHGEGTIVTAVQLGTWNSQNLCIRMMQHRGMRGLWVRVKDTQLGVRHSVAAIQALVSKLLSLGDRVRPDIRWSAGRFADGSCLAFADIE